MVPQSPNSAAASNTNHCTRFCCSDFNRFQDPKVLSRASLTNETLPLLSADRFPPDTDYSIIRPSCQLASLLILSAPRFIVTMTEGDLYIANKDKRKGRRVTWTELDALRDEHGNHFLPNIAKFPTPEHEKVDDTYFHPRARQIIDSLIPMVTFETRRPLPHGIRALTQQLPGPLKEEQAKAFSRGEESRINLSPALLKQLSDYTNRDMHRPSRSLLTLQFQVAKILLHEPGHVRSNAVQGDTRYGEAFHEDCDLAEMGFALENAVFGGLLDTSTQTYEPCETASKRMPRPASKSTLTLHAWPDPRTQYYYEKLGNKLFRSRRELPPAVEMGRIDTVFLERLFSDEYWSSTTLRMEPLHLPIKGRWYEQIVTQENQVRERVCEVSNLEDGEYAKAELQSIIANEIAAGTRQSATALNLATFPPDIPLPPLPHSAKPLPALPTIAAQLYKNLAQDPEIPAGQLHTSIKTTPIAEMKAQHKRNASAISTGQREVERGSSRRRFERWVSDNLRR